MPNRLPFSFEGTSLTGNGQQDLILGSVNCSGTLRWIKVLGGTNNDVSSGVFHSLAVSPLGHVYVGGFMSTPPKFDSDTLHPFTAKRLFLVQYDTNGVYQWLRMPQPDTVSQAYTNRYRFMDLITDSQGNAFFLSIFNEGEIAGSNTVLSSLGPVILHYDPQGNIIDIVSIDMQIPVGTNVTCKMGYNANSSIYYVAGQYSSGAFSINNQPVSSGAYLAAFDAQGQYLWKKVNSTMINAGFTSRPVVDNQGDIFVAGTSSHGDVFDGISISNVLGGGSTRLPFLAKISSSGTTQWLRNGSVNSATYANSIVLSNNEVLIAGSYGSILLWPNEDTLAHLPNQGYDIFLARFSKQTGVLLTTDTLASPFGAHEHSGAVVADVNGNIYLGGEFGSQLYAGADTLLNQGGQSDFFITKFGYPCGCTPPTANFSFSASGSTPQINFLYTGISNVDSMRWDFGDGTTATTVNPQHAFPGNGTYNVCVKVYNPCGVDSSCQTITINCPVPVASFSFMYAGNTVGFSYTGTTADSVFWNFGDGQTATGPNPSHVYAADGTYTVCATAFNGCGSEDTCMTLVVLDVADVNGRAAITVFPNPAKEYLQVVGLRSSCHYKLYNVVGSTVQEGVITANTGQINLQQVPYGTYVLELTGEASVVRVKVFKE